MENLYEICFKGFSGSSKYSYSWRDIEKQLKKLNINRNGLRFFGNGKYYIDNKTNSIKYISTLSKFDYSGYKLVSMDEFWEILNNVNKIYEIY